MGNSTQPIRKRTQGRELALQYLYQWDLLRGNSPHAVIHWDSPEAIGAAIQGYVKGELRLALDALPFVDTPRRLCGYFATVTYNPGDDARPRTHKAIVGKVFPDRQRVYVVFNPPLPVENVPAASFTDIRLVRVEEPGPFLAEWEQDKDAAKFAEFLIRGVRDHQTEIDDVIDQIARNWRLDRMVIVDRTILRLTTFELGYCDEIPPRVSINEGIELAKKYSTEKSSSFVNGILDRVPAVFEARRSGKPDPGIGDAPPLPLPGDHSPSEQDMAAFNSDQ